MNFIDSDPKTNFGFRCTGAEGRHVPRNADAEL